MNLKHIGIIVLLTCFAWTTQAQQDAMFTKYMFNSLAYNPGYAGTKEYLSMTLIHRSQWVGINDAPSAQSFGAHMPLGRENRIGVGLNILNEKSGKTRKLTANISYAYKINFGEDERKSTLSIGLQGGFTNWRTDLKNLDIYDYNDEAFSEQFPSYWLPNFGIGLYYHSKYYFVGVSSPHLIEYDLRTENVTTERYARTARHYYFSAGGAIPLNGDDIVFRPIILLKNTGLLSSLKKEDDPFNNYGSPTEFDVDVSLFFRKTLWVGIGFRSAIEQFDGSSSFDSVDIWASYYLKNGMIVGLAYDYTLTELQQPAKASFEVMLGYDLNFNTNKTYSPRYFF